MPSTTSLSPSAASASAAAAKAAAAAAAKASAENLFLASVLVYVLVGTGAICLAWRVARSASRHRRLKACIDIDNQAHYTQVNQFFAFLRKYVVDAPLFRKRHMNEFRLSSAINVGTLPSRLDTILIAGYLGVNVAFCTIALDWHQPEKTIASQFRNRTGTLAVFNLIPLVIFAGRNNPLITMLSIPFDMFNLLHRSLGRIIVLEAVAHAASYMWVANQGHRLSGIVKESMTLYGLIATIAFVVVLIQSWGPIRHAFYELFLHFHIALVALILGCIWIHIKEFYQRIFLYPVIAVWVSNRVIRLAIIAYRNVGNGGTRAEVEVLEGEAMRVTFTVARPWRFMPGQHAYIYIPRIGWWTSHPFSLAWSDEAQEVRSPSGSELEVANIEKGLVVSSTSALIQQRASVSFLVRQRTGFTKSLYQHACKSPGRKFTSTAFVEGPYSGRNLRSFGTVVLFAGGVGITHQIPYVRDLLVASRNATAATRRVVLVWTVQHAEHLEWIRPWLTELLAPADNRAELKVLLFVSRPRASDQTHFQHPNVQMCVGRPDVQAVVDQEIAEAIGAVAVSVCGTGGLSDDVRLAARRNYTKHNVSFIENAFSW